MKHPVFALSSELVDAFAAASPIRATFWGVAGHDDRWDDLSPLGDAERAAILREFADRAAALEVCLGKLGGDARAAIDRYYGRGEEVAAIAESLGRRANTVAVMLHRARIALAGCIRAALGDGETEPELDPTL